MLTYTMLCMYSWRKHSPHNGSKFISRLNRFTFCTCSNRDTAYNAHCNDNIFPEAHFCLVFLFLRNLINSFGGNLYDVLTVFIAMRQLFWVCDVIDHN